MAPYTPIESLAGGVLMGMSVAAYAGLLGKITGISGNLGSFLTDVVALVTKPFKQKTSRSSNGGNAEARLQRSWQDMLMALAYLAGLIVAGGALKLVSISKIVEPFNGYTLDSISFTAPSHMPIHPILLFIGAGFFVGLGTHLGSGCTSGHMLCGIARLSPRSIVATLVFCIMALVTSKALDTQTWISKYFESVQPSYFPPVPSDISVHWPSLSTGIFLACVVLAFALVFIVLTLLSAFLKRATTGKCLCKPGQEDRQEDLDSESAADAEKDGSTREEDIKVGKKSDHPTPMVVAAVLLRLAIAFCCALSFGVGLALSGMTLPQHVLGFFDISPRWDPSLMMVVVGAVLPNLLFFQGVVLPLTRKGNHSPLAQPPQSKFPKCFLPSKWGDVNARLVVGEAIFGIGWGLTGICPGPALVSVFTGFEVLYYLVGFVVGKAIATLF